MSDQDRLNYPSIPRRRWTPARSVRVAAVSVLPLLAALPLRIWTVWVVGPWEATGGFGSAADVFRAVPQNVAAVGVATAVCRYQAANLGLAVALISLGLFVHTRLFGKRPRERRCLRCSSTRATPGRCPECGA
ncbi:MAG TPA: hypothetical protein VF796_16260, partial [Humisphaera sp.]